MVDQDSLDFYHPEQWGVRCIIGKKQPVHMHLESTSLQSSAPMVHPESTTELEIIMLEVSNFSQSCYGDEEKVPFLLLLSPALEGLPGCNE